MKKNRTLFLMNTFEWIKNIQSSIIMWFLLSYGAMYFVGIYVIKNIFSQFEYDFNSSLAQEVLDNRIHYLNYILSQNLVQNENQWNSILTQVNKLEVHVFSVRVPYGAKVIQLGQNETWNNIHWDKILTCSQKKPSCLTGLMTSRDFGDFSQKEKYLILPQFLNNKTILLHFSSLLAMKNNHLNNLKTTENWFQIIIFMSFLCSIFISYGGVKPLNRFITSLKSKKLVSQNFVEGEKNELNHIRAIRQTIYDLLVHKEQEEQVRLSMQKTLLSQQKESEIGKIVSQISHDLKSPLVVLEDLLLENSFDNFNQNYLAAKRSLNKVFYLIANLKDAEQESVICRVPTVVTFDNILSECQVYAKSKNKKLNTDINLPNNKLSLDFYKLERSLNNLLRNSVEYCKSQIWFKMHLIGDVLEIQCCDDGLGVPKNILPGLFQWRHTGNQETGTGIGLYYAKQIALAHGGDLIYKRLENLTIFTMTIPLVLEPEIIQNVTNLNENLEANPKELLQFNKNVFFFIKDPKKFDHFQEVISKRSLHCVFFNERNAEFECANCSVLYTDSSEAILDIYIEKNVHIILGKATDTPNEIYERLLRF